MKWNVTGLVESRDQKPSLRYKVRAIPLRYKVANITGNLMGHTLRSVWGDESKTHIFLSLFFKYISGLKNSFKCKIMELSPRFMFCSKLMKRSRI